MRLVCGLLRAGGERVRNASARVLGALGGGVGRGRWRVYVVWRRSTDALMRSLPGCGGVGIRGFFGSRGCFVWVFFGVAGAARG